MVKITYPTPRGRLPWAGLLGSSSGLYVAPSAGAPGL